MLIFFLTTLFCVSFFSTSSITVEVRGGGGGGQDQVA